MIKVNELKELEGKIMVYNMKNNNEKSKKTLIETLIQHRTFGNDLPKFIRKNIDDNVVEKLKGKDVTLQIYVIIEEN